MAHDITIKNGNITSILIKNGKKMELTTTVNALEGNVKRIDDAEKPDHWKAIKRRQAYAVVEVLGLSPDEFFKICEHYVKVKGRFSDKEEDLKEMRDLLGLEHPYVHCLHNPHTWCLLHSCFVRVVSVTLEGEENEKVDHLSDLLDKRHEVGSHKRYKKVLRHLHANLTPKTIGERENNHFSMPTLEQMREGFEINKFEREPVPSNVVVN